jgi:hypothetical protein
MAQSWKDELFAEIQQYFRDFDKSKVKESMKKGYLTPCENDKLKLTMAGSKFVDDVLKFHSKRAKLT